MARDLVPIDGHGGRAHSRIGPSAAHRWTACPGSVGRSKHIPNRSTFFTQEGTAAHEFAEHIMTTGHEPSKFLGGAVNLKADKPVDRFLQKHRAGSVVLDKFYVFAIDGEMVEAIELYRDTINSYRVFEGDVEITETVFEQKLDMRHVHPDFYGTGDALVYNPQTGVLNVIDFKYGRGYAVEVADNEQLLSYAIGALHHFTKDRWLKVLGVELCVVQPRAFHHDGPVRKQTMDILDLDLFESWIKDKAAETDRDDAAICVGDQCKWCPISYACVELREHVHLVTGAKFSESGDLTDGDMPDPHRMSQDQLGRVMRQMVIIENWMRSVAAHAHEEAINGRVPTGMKLVEKRAYRHWKEDEEATGLALELAGLSPDEFMTDPQPELKSVAQVEKALGKKAAETILAGLFTKRSSGTVLALIEDARPQVSLDKSAVFGAVEDE